MTVSVLVAEETETDAGRRRTDRSLDPQGASRGESIFCAGQHTTARAIALSGPLLSATDHLDSSQTISFCSNSFVSS